MSKGVRIKIPDDRLDGPKADRERGEFYLDHEQARRMLRYIVEQMAVDKIEGRGEQPEGCAIHAEARTIVRGIDRELYRRYRP